MRRLSGTREINCDALRAYNDNEVRELLGGIGRTTLWELRKRKRPDGTPLLASSYLYPGGPRRTTAAQLFVYLTYLDESSSLNDVGGGRRRRRELREARAS